MSISPRQREFIREYLVDFNGTKAALRCKQTEASAYQYAFRMLSNSEVMGEVEAEQSRRAAVAGLDANWVLDQWKKIAEADPNELMYTRIECCRYCYGIEHAYHWTQPEYMDACNAAGVHICSRKCPPICRQMCAPASQGGFGFDPRMAPNPNCPQCHGEGVTQVKITESRFLKGAARRLYAGVQQDKEGRVKILTRDQDAALSNIAKYLGMVVEKRELSGPNGVPIPVANYSAKDLTDDQLAAIIATDDDEPLTQPAATS